MPKLSPVGVCIYCGGDQELTREHILPSGLRGEEVLPQSSCKRCATETGRIEQRCLRNLMRLVRGKMGINSKHRKRDKTKLYEIEVILPNDKTIKRFVEGTDLPAVLMLPQLDPPGILTGSAIPTDDIIECHPWVFVGENARAEWQRLGAKGILPPGLRFSDLNRMLAKIAHAKVVAELGLDGFTPLLKDFILGRYQHLSAHLIGCCPPSDSEAGILHRLELREDAFGEKRYVAAEIRLFAALGSPIYHVVVGEISGPLPGDLCSSKIASMQ